MLYKEDWHGIILFFLHKAWVPSDWAFCCPGPKPWALLFFLTTLSSSSSFFICLFYFNNDFGHTPKSVKPTHMFSLSTHHGHAFSIIRAQPLAALVASDELPVASAIFQAHFSMVPSYPPSVYVVPAQFLQRHHMFAIRAAEQANSWNREKKILERNSTTLSHKC